MWLMNSTTKIFSNMQADYIADLCNVSLQEDIYAVLAQTDTKEIEKGEFYSC